MVQCMVNNIMNNVETRTQRILLGLLAVGFCHFAVACFAWILHIWPDLRVWGLTLVLKTHFGECMPSFRLLFAYGFGLLVIRRKRKPWMSFVISVTFALTCVLCVVDMYYDRHQLLFLGHDNIPASRVYYNWWWMFWM